MSRKAWFALLLSLAVVAGSAQAQAPPGYYDDADTSSPEALRASLHEIIDDHTRFPYTASETDTWDILEIADEDQDDSDNITTIYRNDSYPKQGGGNSFYNREHTWPKSYGYPNDHPFNYPYTDTHHLFLADISYNEWRSNHPYNNCDVSCTENVTVNNDERGGAGGNYPGDSNWQTGFFTEGSWETWQGRRGDVARALMYTDVRYEGGMHGITGATEPDLVLTDNLNLIDQSRTGANEAMAYMGMLSVLLQWHVEDPVDMAEFQHHETVASFQGNRNPFIDHPEWVACVFEANCGTFRINQGLNDAWVSEDAPFQGFFFTVYEQTGIVFLSWFTFDSVPPDDGVSAVFGAADQRWVTGAGAYSADSVTINVELTSGGIFNGAIPLAGQQAAYGTITVVFINCNEASLTYGFPSPGLSGEMTLKRVLPDNVSLCETLAEG